MASMQRTPERREPPPPTRSGSAGAFPHAAGRRNTSWPLSRILVLIQATMLGGGVILGLAWHLGLVDLADGALQYPLCVFLLLLFAWSIGSWRALSGFWFDPYSSFLAAAFVFNAGQAFLEVFGLNPLGLLDDQFAVETNVKSLLLVSLGMLAFHLGGLLAIRPTPAGQRTETSPGPDTPTVRDVRLVGWGLLILSFPAAVLLFRDAVQVVLTSGYGGLYDRDLPARASAAGDVLATFLVPAALFLLSGSRGYRPGVIVASLVLLTYAPCQLFLGGRYVAIMPLVAAAWVWHVRIRPLPRLPLLAVMTFLVVIVFPLIETIRNVTGEERLSAETLRNAFSAIDNPAVRSIGEMGGTLVTVAHTLEIVPAMQDHDFGLTYFYAVLTLMPNFAWDLHPTIAHGIPDIWLIRLVDPRRAAQGGSLGFSFIAEAYLCFGWPGTPWILALVGFGFAWLVRWAEDPRGLVAARVAMAASFASFFTFFARAEAALVIRPLVWYALLPYLMVFLAARLRRYVAGRGGIRNRPLAEGPR